MPCLQPAHTGLLESPQQQQAQQQLLRPSLNMRQTQQSGAEGPSCMMPAAASAFPHQGHGHPPYPHLAMAGPGAASMPGTSSFSQPMQSQAGLELPADAWLTPQSRDLAAASTSWAGGTAQHPMGSKRPREDFSTYVNHSEWKNCKGICLHADFEC